MPRPADILRHPEPQPGAQVRRRYRSLLGEMKHRAQRPGEAKAGLKHFLKVTKSYGPGLFHGDDVPDLPRTDNALEQLFGSTRHHERRGTARKAASPSLVLRGSVRIVAGVGTRRRSFAGEELAPRNLTPWRTLRATLEERRHARAQGHRFRRDPAAYLEHLEELLQSTLTT